MKVLALGKLALALTAFTLPPQAADTFEIAAIHPSHTDSMNTQMRGEPGGRYLIENVTLRSLIRNAYGLLPFQIVGEPKWTEVDRYDINAKNASGKDITSESLKPLLQGLLAERFHFKAHWETREEPVMALVVDKDGSKLTARTDTPQPGMNTSRISGKATARATGVPMVRLADELGFRLQRFVVDQTGLTGSYDFFLHWNPDTETPAEDSTEPPLATALHEQLGLKLVPTKGPVKVLVIDSAEKPTEN
jgi:uncharacterized protein (TIGR03435 family)